MDTLITAHAIGDHQRVLTAGPKALQTGTREEQQKAIVYMWLAALSTGDHNPIHLFTDFKSLPEDLKESLALLSAVRWKSAKEAECLQKASELASKTDHPVARFVLALVCVECEAVEKAFDLIRHFDDDLDSQVLIVRILLTIDRVDAGRVRVEEMRKRWGEDVRVQVAEACLVQPFETVPVRV